MAAFKDRLTPDLADFALRQPVFFTATAAAGGRINLSPKGLADTFRVLDDRTVAYLDLLGSGNETAAHVAHDGRLTLMFCSFDDKPLILRLYGRGEIARPGTARFDELKPHFPDLPGERQIIVLHVESLQTSCGWGVPRMTLDAERPTLVEWATKKGPAGRAAYEAKNNRTSIDGLAAPTT